jgi:CDP-diglyceride synthetase
LALAVNRALLPLLVACLPFVVETVVTTLKAVFLVVQAVVPVVVQVPVSAGLVRLTKAPQVPIILVAMMPARVVVLYPQAQVAPVAVQVLLLR